MITAKREKVDAMPTAARLIETLGGRRALKRGTESLEGLKARLRKGLPYASLEAVARRYELSQEEIAVLLSLPPRTIARRKGAGRLRADESDRLFRVSRVALLAEEILGSRDKATDWLHRPNRALGNHPPLRHLDTDLGARQVEDILLRMAHGVHS